MLRWEEHDDSLIAYSAGVIIGMVVTRFDGVIVWDISGVAMKWTALAHGEVATMEDGKAAIMQSWGVWLTRAGLGPAK